MIKVGLLGAGRIGAVHAKSIGANPASQLVAIADVKHAAADRLVAARGAQARTVDDMLAEGSIDAVLIASSRRTRTRD